ncbi:hypothetical protein I5M32_11435 [Pedobacter sp. SD-b]|uniref:F5/8 type C domain-containing protein n=1 Tax=Pedobacter segetis TaxID=2793069 RepID=A0ABS1BL00_9SPHI|nr:hypothetical protein [Pedobacter segetis]MBK0383570.1 hypothetical protein [Pedobacter segetis]
MKKVLIQFVFLMCTMYCFAQKSTTVISWNFYGQTAGAADKFAPTSISSDLSSGGITKGSGLTMGMEKLKNYWGAKGFSLSQTGPEEAILNNKYITFSITSNSSKSLSLKEIKPLKIRIFSVGPNHLLLQYSFDGNTYKDITTLKMDRPEKQSDLLLGAVDLSTVKDLQNIGQGKTVYFRIVPWGATKEAYNDFYFGSQYDVPSISILGSFK